MVATVATVAYLGLEARAVEVQVQLSAGLPRFIIVGLPDKAVAESRERVRAALAAIGLALPPKRITVNLSPADLPKEGSHFDLPIALGLLAAIGATDAESLSHYVAVGELEPRRADRRLARRAARRAPRLGAGQGADLPGRPGRRGGLGGQCRGARGARPAGAARASQGHAAAAAPPEPGEAEPLGRRAGPEAGQGAGSRQARARDRRGRRSQSADERAAGRGQVAARRLPARHPAAARAGRGARSVDGRLGRGRAGRRADAAPPAVPRAAP